MRNTNVCTRSLVSGLLIGAVIGFGVGASIEALVQAQAPAPTEGDYIDKCVVLASETRFPTFYIAGQGCVILTVMPKAEKGREL